MELSYTTIDKSTWSEGPWLDEPDKIQWIDAATDLDCLIVRNRHGSLCGYVGLPPGHALHGARGDLTDGLDVHGGITYANGCQDDMPEAEGICHVPAPGRPDDVWWLGFDCGHFMDLAPGMEAQMRAIGRRMPTSDGFQPTYRDVAYVRNECRDLAKQLSE